MKLNPCFEKYQVIQPSNGARTMLKSNAQSRTDHHKIIPTARMVAYYRSFSDIPYAKEASEALGGEDAARLILQDDFDLMTKFSAPFLEARYKCFDRFISSYNNVLELAVGTSVERGHSITNSSEKIYIGTDLPEMIGETKTFFNAMTESPRTNHHFAEANVLSYEELDDAASFLGSRRDVLIINEGLFQYLTSEEQAVCADNIRKLLEKYGGAWVTPDISDMASSNQFIASVGPDLGPSFPRTMQSIKNLTGRHLEDGFFENPQEAVNFFYKHGFEVRQYPLVDEPRRLVSLITLWGERERSLYEPLLRQQLVWVMSLRQ